MKIRSNKMVLLVSIGTISIGFSTCSLAADYYAEPGWKNGALGGTVAPFTITDTSNSPSYYWNGKDWDPGWPQSGGTSTLTRPANDYLLEVTANATSNHWAIFYWINTNGVDVTYVGNYAGVNNNVGTDGITSVNNGDGTYTHSKIIPFASLPPGTLINHEVVGAGIGDWGPGTLSIVSISLKEIVPPPTGTVFVVH